ncbi:MAG TPA: CBS domain-containing protein [Candidatus Bathyarchaeia archaeon]|nr:CBS domain-containing protein [Candidatus Bathyarchaeia archaeon]
MENLRNRKVEDFKSKPIIASPTSSISEIIGTLQNNKAYEVFIEDGNKLGIISMRDILRASDISNMRASSLMTPISKLSPDDAVGKAARLMSDYRLRTLPIGKEKKTDGAITIQSACQALLSIKEFETIRIDKIMKKTPITIGKNESMSKARSLMVKHGIDHLPVLDKGRVCGILLSSQIVLSMFPRERLPKGTLSGETAGYSDLKVAGLMDANVLTCEPEEKAAQVLKRMIEQDKTYAVAEFGEELQGIVTYRDFVGFLAEPEETAVPAYIIGLPNDPFEAQLAQIKFIKEANALRKSFPNIEEIRATIKTKQVSSGKHRYEVSVSIKTHGKIYAYSADGWDLPLAFDGIQSKMKRLLTQKPDRRRRESIRKLP